MKATNHMKGQRGPQLATVRRSQVPATAKTAVALVPPNAPTARRSHGDQEAVSHLRRHGDGVESNQAAASTRETNRQADRSSAQHQRRAGRMENDSPLFFGVINRRCSERTERGHWHISIWKDHGRREVRQPS